MRGQLANIPRRHLLPTSVPRSSANKNGNMQTLKNLRVGTRLALAFGLVLLLLLAMAGIG